MISFGHPTEQVTIDHDNFIIAVPSFLSHARQRYLSRLIVPRKKISLATAPSLSGVAPRPSIWHLTK
jgi:hypothetical protein